MAMALFRNDAMARGNRHLSSRWAWLLLALSLPLAASPPVAAPTATPLQLLPGEYLWLPELAPKGPLLVLVSLPEQRAYVYRNGVRIGVATVSTGKKGHETPTGVFTILQKKREHYSNLYDDAPMPFMQRLTWDGVALHAGRVPGYPASHGCVRLPEAFSEKLFGVTERGMTVVIINEPGRAPMLADPALFPPPPAAPRAGTPVAELALPPPAGAGYTWTPDAAPAGAITVVLSTGDGEMVVLREGVEIGRAPVGVAGPLPGGTTAYTLLEGVRDDALPLLPERPRRRWLRVLGEGGDDPAEGLAAAALRVDPAFVARVYDALSPGATLVVTDERLRPAAALTVLEGDGKPPAEPH